MSEDVQAVAAFVAAASKRVADDVSSAVKTAAVSAFGEQLARLRVEVQNQLDPGAIALQVHPVDLSPVASGLSALAGAVGALELSATLTADSTPVAEAVDALREAFALHDGGSAVVAQALAEASDAHGAMLTAEVSRIVDAVNAASTAITGAINAASVAQAAAMSRLIEATLRPRVVRVKRDSAREIEELRVAPEAMR